MSSYQLLRFRIVVSAVAGLIFLVQSCNPGFLRAPTEPRTLLLHIFLALLGAALLAQAYVLGKQLPTHNSR